MRYPFSDWLIHSEGYFAHTGWFTAEETGDEPATVALQFRLATNGVIVNTLVNGEPVNTTSAGLFNR